ncbi:MAG: metallophosphoesterase [Clostridia bacterium]|nr:metallophosphoesterase [Clostridia bacterium]
MKILVFSDTHGAVSQMKDVIGRNRADTDLVIHLGDNYKDLQSVMLDFPTIASLGVLGNCDFSIMNQNVRYEGCFTAEKRRIFYTHGHKFNVKAGLDYIVSNAILNNADIVLYGHTHIAMFKEYRGVAVINPGSLSCPRDESSGTYAVLEIANDKLKCSIMEI